MLVFCGRKTGASLLAYLIERGDHIDLVVPGRQDDTEIMDLCRAAAIDCRIFSKELCNELIAADVRYDWILSLWNPHVIPKAVLGLSEKRLNLHPSLVPYARGSDSTAWIIREGLPAGVSLIDMTEVLDGGGIYAQKEVRVPFPIHGSLLHARLRDEMVQLFKTSWPDIKAELVRPVPQPEGGSFRRRVETNADRVRSATMASTLEDTVKWILAHDFDPGTTAEMVLDGERYKLRLNVEKAS